MIISRGSLCLGRVMGSCLALQQSQTGHLQVCTRSGRHDLILAYEPLVMTVTTTDTWILSPLKT